MLADDLATLNQLKEGVQEQFDAVELVAETDGLRVSYRKTELVVFRTSGTQDIRWTIQGKRGSIPEFVNSWAKYLGFFVEARGYAKH